MKTASRQQTGPRKLWLYVNIGLGSVLILAGVAVLFWLGQQTPSSSRQAATFQQERTAPDFTLQSSGGQPVALSDYKGQVVLVNTWATWCPPCKAEMPTLNEYYEANKEKGFVVLAVNSQEDADIVNRFVQANGFSFPVLLDPQASVMNLYNVVGLPTSFVIDRDGMIRYIHTGEITRQQLETVVRPLF